MERTILTPTPYCRPVESLNALQAISLKLRSRETPQYSEVDQGVATAVDRHLNMAYPSSAAHLTDPDEDGKQVLFLELLTPLAQERSRKLARTDPAANGEPLLVTVLLPDFAFGISELEAVYGFDIDETLEGFAGGETFTVIHQECLYIEGIAAFTVIGIHHPSLLLALAHPLMNTQGCQVRELLSSLGDVLSNVEVFLREHSSQPETPRQVYQICVSAFEQTEEVLRSLLSSSSPLRDLMVDAYIAILADERQTLNILHDSDPDVMDSGEQPLPSIAFAKLPRRARRRLARLRGVIPCE